MLSCSNRLGFRDGARSQTRMSWGLLTLPGRMPLRAKIGLDEAEEAAGAVPSNDDNEGWPDLRRNPQRRDRFSPLRCPIDLSTLGIAQSPPFWIQR